MATQTSPAGFECMDFGDGDVSHFGTREALLEVGLLPVGCPMLGEQPGRRGVRWLDEQGMRCVLSKHGAARQRTYTLTRHPTKAEKTSLRYSDRTQKRLAETDARLAEIDVSEEAFVSSVRRDAGIAFHWLLAQVDPDARRRVTKLPGAAWRYPEDVAGKLACLYEEAFELLEGATPIKDGREID